MTGARIGMSSEGRAYVHGGRGGLYYRKSLGTGGGERSGDRGAGAAGPAPGPIELTEDTGVTYGAPREREQATDATDAPLRRSPPTYGWLALGAVAAGLLLPSPWPAAVAAAVFAALVALAARRGRRRAAGDAYGRLLDARVDAAGPATDEDRAAIDAARGDRGLTPADARYFEERAYLSLLEAATANGAGDPRLFERLAELETLVSLDPAFRRRARLDAYSRAHVEAVSDHDLTEAEEQALDRTRTALGLTDEELADELALIDRLRELRSIRAGDLPVVDAAARLSSREVCHLESEGPSAEATPAALVLPRRSALQGERLRGRQGRRAARHQSPRGADPRRRVLVPLGKILDVEVDQDRQLLVLTRDGVATPTYLTTPDALRAGAIVASLTEPD